MTVNFKQKCGLLIILDGRDEGFRMGEIFSWQLLHFLFALF
jgi:hypothetical protein